MKTQVNLTIRARLLLGFGLAALLTLAVAIVAFLNLRSLGESLSSMAASDRLLQTGAIELRLSIEQESSAVRGYLLTGNTDFLADFTSAKTQYASKLEQLRRMEPSREVSGLLSDVDALHTRYVGIANEQATLRDMGFSQSAVFLWQTQGNDIKSSLDSKLVALVERQESIISSHAVNAQQQQNRTLVISLVLVLATWGAAIFGWHWISQSITMPIRRLLSATQSIGMGKLDTRVEISGNDEFSTLGSAMNRMAEELSASREKARELATLGERQRLARDLHDAVSQTLFSASLIAEVLPRLWERNLDKGHRRLEAARQLTRGALAEMRTLLLEPRPASLIEAELPQLLRQLGESISGRARVPVAVSVEGNFCFSNEVKIALYRIAQEALNNVAKHAAARKAEVILTCTPDKVALTIADNGRGFDIAVVPPDSLGLGIMRERARDSGASLSIESKPGQGTTITAVWENLPKGG